MLIELRAPYPVEEVDPLTIVPDPGVMGQMYIGAREKYSDGMTLACATPRQPYEDVKAEYVKRCNEPDFSDVAFFEKHFEITPPDEANFIAQPGQEIDDYILAIRPKFIFPNTTKGHFDTWLPYPRSVAGVGRFGRHSFLWDGYQMTKGYAAAGRWDLVLNVLDNTEYQINRFGHPINGSADFYVSRPQPDYFAHQVRMLADKIGPEALVRYLPAMEKNHKGYWLDGMEELANRPIDGQVHTHRSLVRMPDGSFLNRYWDDANGPRLESYKEDVEIADKVIALEGLKGALAHMKGRKALHDMLYQLGLDEYKHVDLTEDMLTEDIQKALIEIRKQQAYKDLRAGAASGWDFSSRWFKDGSNLVTINTTDIAPVDLNSLMVYNEETLAMAYEAASEMPGYNKLECLEKAAMYQQLADRRAAAINKYLWDPKDKIYRDYNFVDGHQTAIVSAAMAYPLYVGINNKEQAMGVADAIETDLLYEGGVIATTTEDSEEQWDGGKKGGKRSKNVWAPPNWATVRGLARAAHRMMIEAAKPDPIVVARAERLLKLAEKCRAAYMHGVEVVFSEHRVITEKHRGDNPAALATGGEYQLVKVLAMPIETYVAMQHLDPRDAADHLPKWKYVQAA